MTTDLDVAGSLAYVTTEYGLTVVDISDPTAPVERGSCDDCGWMAAGVEVVGTLAYLAVNGHALRVVDVYDPWLPYCVGSCENWECDGRDVAVSGIHAYVADRYFGLRVIDVSNPTLPVEIGSVPLDGRPNGVDVAGNLVYVACGDEGLYVVDAADPTAPEEIASFQTGDSSLKVDTDGQRIHVSDADDGLWILRFDTETGAEMSPSPGRIDVRVHPNPFNPQTTITLSLEREERATVAVFDLTGRRIAVLADGIFTVGPHPLTWNGRNSQGRAMPSGTYIVRLETESGVEARKVMLVR
jgi:DNA-binding beta-propeller fold protein YncE